MGIITLLLYNARLYYDG